MTKSFAASDISPKPTRAWGHWLLYLFLGLVGNAAIWGLALAYINSSPTYTSKWALTLPGTASTTNVNVPNIGTASSSSGPIYDPNRGDPRENYKFIVESDAVRKAAAARLNIPVGELSKPRIKVIENTTLISFEVEAEDPKKSREHSMALYAAFQDRLRELRSEEAAQQKALAQGTLVDSQKKLEIAQRRMSDYKARSGLASDAQIEQLSASIEQLRQKRAELLAQERDTTAQLSELSANLNLSASQATDAFALKADKLYQQYRQEYSTATSTLGVLNTRYGPNHPSVVRERSRQQAALSALEARSQSLIGRSVDEASLAKLNVDDGNQGGSSRETLFQQLVTVQVAQEGQVANVQELNKQIAQLETRLQTLAQYDSTLEGLQRDLQIAETVFSSTLAGLDIGKLQKFGSYPQVQLLAEPSLPKSPTSPNKQIGLLGASGGSLFYTTGLLLFALRQHLHRKRRTLKVESLEPIEPTERTHTEPKLVRPESRTEVLDLSK